MPIALTYPAALQRLAELAGPENPGYIAVRAAIALVRDLPPHNPRHTNVKHVLNPELPPLGGSYRAATEGAPALPHRGSCRTATEGGVPHRTAPPRHTRTPPRHTRDDVAGISPRRAQTALLRGEAGGRRTME